MSHHSRRLGGLTVSTLRELEQRSRVHPPRIYAPGLYFGSLTAGNGPKLLLVAVAEVVLRGKVFSPSQRRLGELYRRDRRSVSRWVKVGVERGWLRVVRRGRKLTNVYRLSRHLWGRLTGQYTSKIPSWLRSMQGRLALHFTAEPAKMSTAADSRRL